MVEFSRWFNRLGETSQSFALLFIPREHLAVTIFCEKLLLHSRSEIEHLYSDRPTKSQFLVSIIGQNPACSSRLLALQPAHTESMLRYVIRKYLEYYDKERNHQGLDNKIIEPAEEIGLSEGAIKTRDRLGRMLRYYYFDAA